MSTKAEIQAKIQARLTGSAEDLTWTRHEEMLMTGNDNLLDNVYGFAVTDSNATTNVVTENNANKTYLLNITKTGLRVFVDGNVRNGTGALTASNEVFFTITTTEYQQQAGTQVIFGRSASTGDPIRFLLTSNSFGAIDPIGINELVEFRFSYNTNA